MQYSVMLNKDQQKMVVKLFFLVSENIFSNKNFLNFLLMNLFEMNRTQQTLLFSNEATIILIVTFLKKGSFNTAGSTSRLNFHIPEIKKRDTFSV